MVYPHSKKVGVSSREHRFAYRVGGEVLRHKKKVEIETGALDEHDLKTDFKVLEEKKADRRVLYTLT